MVADGSIEVGALSIPVTIRLGVCTVRMRRGDGLINRMIAACCDEALPRAAGHGRNRVEEQALAEDARA